MLDEALAIPDDPDDLRSFAVQLVAEVKAQAMLIEKLRHQVAGHQAWRYGASSEASAQLQLALETSELAAAAMAAQMGLPEEADASAEEADVKAKPVRRPVPDHVPRNEVEIAPSSDSCGACGGTLRKIGEDVTEELEYVPARFVVNRITRPRFTCTGCERFVQSPLPSRPIERGRPGPGLLAQTLVSKYGDHAPLYRQSQIYAREGIDLSRATMAEWVGRSTALLEPLAEAIGRHVLESGAIHADDTPVRMLAPGTGKTKTARLWTYVRDERAWNGAAAPGALYRFSPDRKGIHPARHLAGFEGWMHAPSRDHASHDPAGQWTAMPGSRTSIDRVGCARWRASPMCAASSFAMGLEPVATTSPAHRAPGAGLRDRKRGHQPHCPALRRREGDPRFAARRARTHPPREGRAGLRRP